MITVKICPDQLNKTETVQTQIYKILQDNGVPVGGAGNVKRGKLARDDRVNPGLITYTYTSADDETAAEIGGVETGHGDGFLFLF